MITNKKLLSTVLHTTQMGQTGIRTVMPMASRAQLRQELKQQLEEYDAIEIKAQQIAAQRGWDLGRLSPALALMSKTMARARLVGGNADSKIAGMLIQGNTRGMITGLKNLHQAAPGDASVQELAMHLVDRESVNIQKSQQFL